ncbi:MAG: hypothetical protein ACOCUV_01710 [bacterium]
MSKFYKILLVIFLAINISSCNIYNDEEIIEYGEEAIKLHSNELLNIFYLVNELITDTFTMHSITISNSTNHFVFFTFDYDEKYHDKKFLRKTIKLEPDLKNIIRNSFPKKKTTSLVILKDIFVSFELYRCRNRQYEYAKLLYIKNKEAFVKLFSEYRLYTSLTEIKNKTDWVYFYDDRWAITTSSDVMRLTKEECKN